MNTLSLCVICKNEEDNIGNLLESTKGDLFDEIIVVDTGSTDKTIDILKNYDVTIENFEWVDDFSAARNYSFSKASSDYIMWLDSDDYLLEKDYNKLLELKKSLQDSPIWLMRYEYAHDEFGKSICSFYRERIIKRDLGLKWEQPIHEYIPLSYSFKKVDIEVHHNKKEINSERNIKILESIVEKNPINSRNIYYLGKEYFDAGQKDRGSDLLIKFVNMPDSWSENKFSAYKRLGEYEREKGNYSEAIDYYLKAIRVDDLKADPYYYIGDIHLQLQQYDHAIHWLKIASNMDRPKDSLDIIEPKYYTWLPNLQLCLAYNSIGDLINAAKANEEALKYRPEDLRILNNKQIFLESLGENYPTLEGWENKFKKTEETYPEDNWDWDYELKKLPSVKGKIGWYVPENENFASYRIRMLNINHYLKEKGYDSEVYNSEKDKEYKFIVTGKIFNSENLDLIKKWKKQGKTVFCDLNEDILEYREVKEIVKNSDFIICCSDELAKKSKKYNENTLVIEDASEYFVED